MKTEHSSGWAIRVGGPRPYLAWGAFENSKDLVREDCTAAYHKPVRVVMLTLHEYRRIKRAQTNRTRKA